MKAAAKIDLTKRQRDCLNLTCQGYSAKEIAKFLNISSRTVETHINALKLKLGAVRKTALWQLI